MNKVTNSEKLLLRQEKQPNAILYAILMLVVKILNIPVKPTFIYKAKPAEEKGPFILVSNHASRCDYLFTAPVCWPKRLNYVVGYNEFFVFPTLLMLKMMQVIPKKNFTPDVHTIRAITRIIRSGGNVCIMPEGMSSITGMSQPVMRGIGKMLKKLGVPVYYTKISGGYMSFTKHDVNQRNGRVEVVVDKMFTPDQLKSLSEVEIEDAMDRLLAHDDYIWNREAKVEFPSKFGMAYKLDTLLYMCPKCGALYRHKCEGDRMQCTGCGNTIEMDKTGMIHAVGEDSVCPPLVTDWTLLEREKAARDVRKEGFSYSGHVKVGTLPEHGHLPIGATSIITGEGDLTLTAEGLSFEGQLEGAPYSFKLPIASLPTFGMCTDISRFYTFVDGKFLEFYPDNGDALRWDHLTEEMHRAQGGKWQNTPYRHI